MKFFINFCFFSFFISCSLEKKNPELNSENTKKSGFEIYTERCITCHGLDGTLGMSGAKNLKESNLPISQIITQVTNGKGAMASFKNILTSEEIDSVSNYVFNLRK